MTQPCTQEATIAVISTNIHNIKDGIEGIKNSQEKLFKKLDGNGEVGLITESALNQQSIARLWKFLYISIPSALTLAGLALAIIKYA